MITCAALVSGFKSLTIPILLPQSLAPTFTASLAFAEEAEAEANAASEASLASGGSAENAAAAYDAAYAAYVASAGGWPSRSDADVYAQFMVRINAHTPAPDIRHMRSVQLEPASCVCVSVCMRVRLTVRGRSLLMGRCQHD